MPTKICILTTVHPPFDTRIFHKEAKTLVKAGYDVSLIAQHKRDEVVDGVKIVSLPKPHNRFTRIFVLSWRALRLALQLHADVYHFHDPELLFVGVLLKLLTRGKIIYDVHEDVPEQILSKLWLHPMVRRPVAWAFNIIEKCAARSCNAVIVATEGIAERFIAHHPVIIHNYPDLGLFPGSPRTRLRDEMVVVYVGAISKLRGAFEMVGSLKSLDESLGVVLKLIGRYQPLELERELQALEGNREIESLGWLPSENVYEHLVNADIGLVCLHPEPRYIVSLPVKLFEYMAAGIAVIASDFPLWKEIVEKNHCGLMVDPLSSKEIADAIRHLATHPDEAEKMGRNGRRAVEEMYNWQREGDRLVKLYEELLAR